MTVVAVARLGRRPRRPTTIQLSGVSLSFTASSGGANPATQTVTASAAAGAGLTALSLGTGGTAAWCTPTASGLTVTVAIAISGLGLGTHATSFTVTAGNAANTVTVSVSLEITAASGAASALNSPSTTTYRPRPADSGFDLPQKYLDVRSGHEGVYDIAGVAIGTPVTVSGFTEVALTASGNVTTDTNALVAQLAAAATRAGHTRITLGDGFIAEQVNAPTNALGSYWCYVEALNLANYGAEGIRCNTAAMTNAPQIRVVNNNHAALGFAQGAHRYRFSGIVFTNVATTTDVQWLVLASASSPTNNDPGLWQTQAAHIPQWIVFDRCWFRHTPNGATYHCIQGLQFDCDYSAVIDCDFSNIYRNGYESHAIIGINANGPQKCINNKMVSGGIQHMYGGADPTVPNAVFKDLEIRHEWWHRPDTWCPFHASFDNAGNRFVKACFEVKQGDRVLVEGCLADGVWVTVDGGNFRAINVKVENQSGGTDGNWVYTKNVVVRHSRIRRAHGGFQFGYTQQGPVAEPMNRVEFSHMLFEDLGNAAYGDTGRLYNLIVGISDDIVLRHLTFVSNGNTYGRYNACLYFSGTSHTGLRFVLKDCVGIGVGAFYAIAGDSGGGYGPTIANPREGNNTFAAYCTSPTVANNAIIGTGISGNYPADHVFAASTAAMQYTDLAARNYRLTAASPGYLGATDGTDMGANIADVELATSGVDS